MEEQNQQHNQRPISKRRKFLINEHFQLHFIGFATVLSLCACVLFYVAGEYFFDKYYGFAIDAGMRPADPFFKVLANMRMLLTYIFAFTSLLVVLVSVIGGLLFSNRVAGPMYRLRKHFEAVARGETWTDVAFRKGDYFEDLATAYNIQMHYIREKFGIELERTAPGGIESLQQQVSVTESPDEPSMRVGAEDDSDGVKKAS